VNGDWRVFRPAIWIAMLGVAVLLVVNVYAGIALVGAAIGVGLRISTARRRISRGRSSGRRGRG
jgi:hypothetical protein